MSATSGAGFLAGELGDLVSGQLTIAYDADEVEAYAEAMEATPPEWWEQAYKGGEPVGPKDLPRPLYFPGNPSGKPVSKDGPDVLAVKRAVWRGGRWPGPASSFDDSFSKAFALGKGGNVVETGLAGFQRQMRIEDSGQLGDQTYQAMRYARVPSTFPHGGEPLFDEYAVTLLNQAAEQGSMVKPGQRAEQLADYCRDCIGNEPRWHYQQIRPMTHLGNTPDEGGNCDCSSHATGAYFWVGAPDPNHRGYDGYGYTGTLINNPKVVAPYQVGDLALYGESSGSTEHVTTCYQAGSDSSSRWCSHGSEEAPYSVGLYYRGDLLCVVRPGLA